MEAIEGSNWRLSWARLDGFLVSVWRLSRVSLEAITPRTDHVDHVGHIDHTDPVSAIMAYCAGSVYIYRIKSTDPTLENFARSCRSYGSLPRA